MNPNKWVFNLALFLDFVTVLLFVIGFGTPNWYYNTTETYGLWQYCYEDEGKVCRSYLYHYGGSQDWWEAVQTLECFGLIFMVVSANFVIGLLCDDGRQHRRYKLIIGICMGLSGACILTGIILFGVKMTTSFGYSYWLCAISGGLAMIVAVLFFKDPRRRQAVTRLPVSHQLQTGVQYPVINTQINVPMNQYHVGYDQASDIQHPRTISTTDQYPVPYPQTPAPGHIPDVLSLAAPAFTIPGGHIQTTGKNDTHSVDNVA